MCELITKDERDLNVLLKGSIFFSGNRQKEKRSLYFKTDRLTVVCTTDKKNIYYVGREKEEILLCMQTHT